MAKIRKSYMMKIRNNYRNWDITMLVFFLIKSRFCFKRILRRNS